MYKNNIPFNSTIIFLSGICSVGCSSCSAFSSPDSEHAMTPLMAEKTIEKTLELSGAPFVVFTGGEPFATPDTLQAGLTAAAGAGYACEILTSGSWYLKQPHLLNIISDTRRSRVSLRISLDAEHQKKVAVETIAGLARDAISRNIPLHFTLRNIPGMPSGSSYLHEITAAVPGLLSASGDSRHINYIPHVELSSTRFFLTDNPVSDTFFFPEKPCVQGFKDLVINCRGHVYPCCGLVGCADYALISPGNLLETPWHEIRENAAKNPLLKLLQTRGPGGLYKKIFPEALARPSVPISHACQLCITLFRDFSADIEIPE